MHAHWYNRSILCNYFIVLTNVVAYNRKFKLHFLLLSYCFESWRTDLFDIYNCRHREKWWAAKFKRARAHNLEQSTPSNTEQRNLARHE